MADAQPTAEGMVYRDGQWRWTDPSTGLEMVYNQDQQAWTPAVTQKDGNWTCTDPATGKELVWNATENRWQPGEEVPAKQTPADWDDFEFQLRQEAAEQQQQQQGQASAAPPVYTDPKDNTVYEWDEQRRGWFPKVDTDFLAQYFSAYGDTPLKLPSPKAEEQEATAVSDAAEVSSSNDTLTDSKERKEFLRQQKKEKRRLAAERERNRGWFEMDDEHNTSVYVSNLPLDTTIVEFEELMSKYGVIARDLLTKKLKLKLYKAEDGSLKGDGLCTYIKRESVELAERLLDDYDLRGHKLKIQLAKFELKGSFDPTKKAKRLTAKQKKLLKEKQNRIFDWRPDRLKGERPKSDNTVILRNAFTLEELAENAAVLFDIEEELKIECAKQGQIRKVVVYDNNPEGVVSVTFESPEEADDCITMMNWRMFRGKQLRADRWDGVTKYKREETEEEVQKRLGHWQSFLESEGADKSEAKG